MLAILFMMIFVYSEVEVGLFFIFFGHESGIYLILYWIIILFLIIYLVSRDKRIIPLDLKYALCVPYCSLSIYILKIKMMPTKVGFNF